VVDQGVDLSSELRSKRRLSRKVGYESDLKVDHEVDLGSELNGNRRLSRKVGYESYDTDLTSERTHFGNPNTRSRWHYRIRKYARSTRSEQTTWQPNPDCISVDKTDCTRRDGRGRYNVHPDVQSGLAAMGLLLKRRSSDEVMMLGRWKTKAFLDYIRPQVVELTTGLSKDTISPDTFSELCSRSRTIRENSEPLMKHYDMPRWHDTLEDGRLAFLKCSNHPGFEHTRTKKTRGREPVSGGS